MFVNRTIPPQRQIFRAMPANELFSETQFFGKKWWPILLPTAIIPVAMALAPKNPFSADADPDAGVGLLVVLSVLSLTWGLFFAMRLRTRITDEGVHVRFWPFHLRGDVFFPWEKIQKAYVRTYNPLFEYGGWGLRYGFSHGKAYNVWGNKGLQLELADGKKVLIGTQDPEGLKAALEKLGKGENQ